MAIADRRTRRLTATVTVTLVALGCGVAALPALGAGGGPGGASITGGGLAPGVPRVPIAPRRSRHAHGRWLGRVTITEYWPAPESWFVGRLVKAPGLSGLHRVDWLYSAMGVSMEGDGIGLDGRTYHIQTLGRGGWVTAAAKPTQPGNGWSGGAPYWRDGGYWLSRRRRVTFPLAAGGWSAAAGRRYVPLHGVSFAPGPSIPLRYWQSIAVDPRVIALGSRVYVPAYRQDGHGGWFIAQDTGGAILGHHIDVYRPPPASPLDGGDYLTDQRIFVIAPRR
ncbi:MAG: 3D domain-containing protein [Solirubrobacteraceae bacterium]